MEERIFVSYSTQDGEIARKVVEYLEANGRRCWIAPRDIASGLDYSDVITKALKECSVVVLVFSRNSAASQFVKKEITLAVSFNKRILPLRISQVDISGGWHFLLNNVQWIEATSSPEKHFPQLLAGLGQEVVAPPPPPEPKKAAWGKWVAIGGAALAALVATLLLTTGKGDGAGATDSVARDTIPALPPEPTAVVDTAAAKDTAAVATPPKTTDNKDTDRKKDTDRTKGTRNNPEERVERPQVVVDVVEEESSTKEEDAKNGQKSKKMEQVYRHMNRQEYSEALRILHELRQDHPSDVMINRMIKNCNDKIQNSK